LAILTLTTDIGLQDYLAGAIKGQLLSIYPAFQLIDISHSISPFNYSLAAYISRNSFWQFPVGSFHLLLVNLFETRPHHFLLAYHNGQYIACADNGLLPLVCNGQPEQVVSILLETTAPKTTLYCTGEMGKACKQLVEGKTLDSLGSKPETIVEMISIKPGYGDNWMEGQVLHVDHFENVIINITLEEFEEQRRGRKFKLIFKRDEVIDRISETYADVPQHHKLALFNSAGYLEIAINKGNAAGLFGLQVFKNETQAAFQQSRLYYQKVRILFE
jgi:S-adenosyl-L-methionine hydrolase (adenosine-forming)